MNSLKINGDLCSMFLFNFSNQRAHIEGIYYLLNRNIATIFGKTQYNKHTHININIFTHHFYLISQQRGETSTWIITSHNTCGPKDVFPAIVTSFLLLCRLSCYCAVFFAIVPSFLLLCRLSCYCAFFLYECFRVDVHVSTTITVHYHICYLSCMIL